ncbi:MAG: hypothetical protein WB729_16380 [Candidatus Sulfotelmatobacter sp.]
MEALKVMALIVGISLGVAALGTFLLSLVLDPLENLRLRWVAKEREAAKHSTS